jgi:hypothetical protein
VDVGGHAGRREGVQGVKWGVGEERREGERGERGENVGVCVWGGVHVRVCGGGGGGGEEMEDGEILQMNWSTYHKRGPVPSSGGAACDGMREGAGACNSHCVCSFGVDFALEGGGGIEGMSKLNGRFWQTRLMVKVALQSLMQLQRVRSSQNLYRVRWDTPLGQPGRCLVCLNADNSFTVVSALVKLLFMTSGRVHDLGLSCGGWSSGNAMCWSLIPMHWLATEEIMWSTKLT